MNSTTVNWEGRFQRVKSRLALWKARNLTLLRKVLVLKADMLSSVLHLAPRTEWSGVEYRGGGQGGRMGGPVNFSGGTAQDFEVPVEEQRQGSDAKGFVLHQNHQGPVESDGGRRFLYSVASAGNRVSGPVVDSSRFCCTQMFPVLLHPDAEEAIRADASVMVTLVPGGGDLRVKHSQYADDTTLLVDSDECVVRALELFEDFGRVSGARLNIGKCTVKGVGRGVMLLRMDYRACAQGGHALLYVFPLPVAIRQPLARTIFDFL
ncbi:hypothetical protein Q8A73_006293 [Channa argus]|nr:hypothetical protein Q8A73_006289 [Channa argus]KAK2912180.1 hypothetical protein Q8A73_006293 [Channa argus]